MSRKHQASVVGRPALLGDRTHTTRLGRRLGILAFAAALLILSPLAYALVRAGGSRIGPFGVADVALVGGVIVAVAGAFGFAVCIGVHLLGHEARRRRTR